MTPCAAGCVQRGHHLPDCTYDQCPGCLPRLAAEQSAACSHCEAKMRARISGQPRDGDKAPVPGLADLWADLAERPRLAIASGPPSGGGTEACRACDRGEPCDLQHATLAGPLADGPLAARSTIKQVLVTWCRILSEDPYRVSVPSEDTIAATTRRLASEASREAASHTAAAGLASTPHWDPSLGREIPPDPAAVKHHKAAAHRLHDTAARWRAERETGRDIIAALADHIDRQLGRLLADPWTAQALIDDIGTAWVGAIRYSNPSRRDGLAVACDCGARMAVEQRHTDHPESEPLTCRACGLTGALSWWTSREDLSPVRLSAAVDWLAAHGLQFTWEQVRWWADQGLITPLNEVVAGRARLYDPQALLAVAVARQAGAA